MLFYIGLAILLSLGIYCWLATKTAYDKAETLPLHVSIAVWILDAVHLLLVLISSLRGVWPLPINKIMTLTAGSLMVSVGLAVMLTAMLKFHSFRRISGMDASVLITKGIYRWSRNPQHAGWFLSLLGISAIGRSALAFLFTVIFIIAMHLYTVRLEEPYLERIFGEDYRIYKSRTARYIRIPTNWQGSKIQCRQ